MRRRQPPGPVWPALLLGLLLAGCVQTGPVGRWEPDAAVERQFRAGKVFPGHTYYFYGSEVLPDAILAIDNRYTLKTKVWSRVEISEKMMADWAYWISTEIQVACPYRGGVLFGPGGERIGVWWTRKDRTVIRMPEPGVVQVYAPYNFRSSPCGRLDAVDER